MKRTAVRSLRIPLYLLVFLALLPAFGVILYRGMEERRSEAQRAGEHALDFSRQAAHEQQHVVLSTHELLEVLARQDEISGSQVEDCRQLLSDLLPSYPFLANLGAARLDGEVYCSAVPFTGSVNISDRSYFQRALASDDFSTGEFQVGRITGRVGINFGYPVRGSSGAPFGVVYAAVDLDWLGELAGSAGLPEGSTVTVLDSAGTVLARYPKAGEWVGRRVPEEPIFQMIEVGQGEGTFEAAGLDGERRLYGYTSLLGSHPGSVYVVVGIPASEAYAGVDRATMRGAAALGVVLVLGLIAAWAGSEYFLLRRMRRMAAAARKIAEGDLSARTELPPANDEAGDVAAGLDSLAEANQRRIVERDRALAKLSTVLRAMRTLSETNKALVRASTEEDLLRTVCDVVVYLGGYCSAWVGYAEQDEMRTVRAMAHAGMPEDHLSRIRLGWGDNELGCNPIGAVIRNATPELIQDLRDESHHAVWEAAPFDDKCVSAIILPLASGPQAAFGVLIIAAVEPEAFTLEAVQLLEDLARDLGYGIGGMRERRAREAAEQQLERQLERLESLRMIDTAILSVTDLKVTAAVLLDQVTGQLGADAADVLLLNPLSGRLEHFASRGFRTRALEYTQLRLGEGQAGKVAASRKPVMINSPDVLLGEFAMAPLLKEEGFVSYYAAPLVAKGELKGVLEVFGRKPFAVDREWEGFLATLAGVAAVAIDNGRLFEGLQRSSVELVLAYDATIEGWSRALDLRDKETEGHTQRVAELTERLVRQMGFSEEALVHIHRGALLHDIGKMGVPDNILLKPGPLTDEEWIVMRRHPQLAFELLSPIQYLVPGLDIPYCHHERWDGTGYPRGLAGEAIPLAARVFAVVDVWDALRSDRPYRPAWPEDKVRQYIGDQAGKLFDPRVVDMFLSLGPRDAAEG